MTHHPAPLAAAALALILLAVPATGPAQAEVRPVVAGSVVVRKNPGNAIVVGTSGGDGRVSARVRVEAGEYEVSVACPRDVPCALAWVGIDGRRLTPTPRGAWTFPVGPRTGAVTLTAQVVEAPAAAGDGRGPDCAAVFRDNRERIEALAAAGRANDIAAVFTGAGCARPSVEIPSPSAAADPRRSPRRITCEATLLPPRIRCTFLAVPRDAEPRQAAPRTPLSRE